jgi:hypothetical protein
VERKRVQLTRIKQYFGNESLKDIRGGVGIELKRLSDLVKPKTSVAIAAGSRGIRNIAVIVSEVAEFVKYMGAEPFIVPAMGSHGEADARKQAEILAGYGISEKELGIPVKSSMDVVELPRGRSPFPLCMDRNAWNADAVILVNRIKPHTDFHARYESGLVKMSVIGLGKERQALNVHSFGVYGLSELIPQASREILSSGRIIGGLAIIENGYDETMEVKALRADEILEKEPGLLEKARRNMASLPVDETDLLFVDRMGKDISGVGLDPNIIGRIRITGQPEPEAPRIKAIVISDLTEASHGNAIGIGLADTITRRLYDKIDFASTYVNAKTSSFLERVKVPLVADTDREAFDIALRSCGYLAEGAEKIIRIRDTLHLDEIYVSDPVLEIIRPSANIEIISGNHELFLINGDLTPF